MFDRANKANSVSFFRDGPALAGFVLFVSGGVIACVGLFRIRDLWIQIQPALPLSLSVDVPEMLVHLFPSVLSVVVNFIASVCAVLMGIAWGFSGIASVVKSHRSRTCPSDLNSPELVAEALRSSWPAYCFHVGPLLRILSALRPAIMYMNPLSKEILGDLRNGCLKATIAVILIACAVHLVSWIPGLLRKTFDWSLVIAVPSASPIYLLLGLVMLAYVMIGWSLLPTRHLQYIRGIKDLRVGGTGPPDLFFALLEESSILLDLGSQGVPRATRLELSGVPGVRATLIESSPQVVESSVKPLGFALLPLALVLPLAGFARLIYFQPPVASTLAIGQFFATHGLECLVEIAFCLALIIAGLRLGYWGERLLNVRRFRSALVFCRQKVADEKTFFEKGLPQFTWQKPEGWNESLADWAERPEVSQSFSVEICWAELVSEAEGIAGPRQVVDIRLSPTLEALLERILVVPFALRFENITEKETLDKERKPHEV